MTQNNPTVVFDWNGTIVEDTEPCFCATNETLRFLGVPAITMETYRAHYDVPLLSMYVAFGCDERAFLAQKEAAIHTFFKTYEEQTKTLQMRGGAESVLQTLKNQKYNVTILSNYTVEKIKKQAEKINLHHHLGDILANEGDGGDAFHVGKKARLEKYLSSRKNRDGMIIGDTVEEIDIGRSLGLCTVAVENGACSTARLKERKPDYIVESLADIPALAQKVLGGGSWV